MNRIASEKSCPSVKVLLNSSTVPLMLARALVPRPARIAKREV